LQGFDDSFRQAARRDFRTDAHGNIYLPVRVGSEGTEAPEKGQYAFLLPVRQAQFFQHHDQLIDSIVTGNLRMLDATLAEGLPGNSGWLSGGVWPWLGGVQAIARLLYDNPRGAVEMVYAVANHALPTGVWVEEQLPRDRGPGNSGDASNAEAAGVFFQAVRDLIAQERVDGLALLGGIPPEWIRPDKRISLDKSLTEFGPLTLTVTTDGSTVNIDMEPVDGHGKAGSPYVCLDAFAGYRFSNGNPLPLRWEGAWGQPIHLRLESF